MNLRKIWSILLITICGITTYAQTAAEKKAEKTDLDNVKRFYGRLKGYKIDPKTDLIWTYTYQDSTEAQLKKLASAFEGEGLKVEGVTASAQSNKEFELKLTEIKKYSTPESLHERVKQLNQIALGYKIMGPYASFAAEKQKKEGEIGSYKKVGKEDKK